MIAFNLSINHFKKHNQPIWILKDQKVFSEDLLIYRNNISDILKQSSNKKIAVYFSNTLHLVETLVLLQGIASDILLIPWGTDEKLIETFTRHCETNLIISDKQIEKIKNIDCINIFQINKTNHFYDVCTNKKIETNWIIPTSGTTGIPKIVTHTLSSLTRTVKRNLEIGRNLTWGLLYDVTRFAGLQVFLQSFLGGSSLILTNNHATLDARISDLANSKVNSLSATPTMWRQILMFPQTEEMKLKQITLGGEIVDDTILQSLRNRFSVARITHIYASTEAGVGFAVHDDKAGFPVAYIDKAPNNIQIKINHDGMMYLKTSNNKYRKYLGSSEILIDDEGFIKTGDIVEKKGERYYFLGRANGAINVGGNKVMPEEVEQVILRFPGVKIAKVASKKSSITGELVTATVEINQSIENDKEFNKKLTKFCSQHLEKYKVPALIMVKNFIEINQSGKMERHE